MMKRERKKREQISRRNFVKSAAAGAGAGVVAGMDVKDSKAGVAPIPDRWDKETDVVVVGFGGAGAVTAITAYDAGAKVLILEKAPVEGGGLTRMAGGQTAYTELKDAAGAAEYLYAGSFGATPMDVCQAWAEEIANNGKWLTQMGMTWNDMPAQADAKSKADFQNFPGAYALKCMGVNGGGAAFFKTVTQHIQKRGIEILFDTPGTDLIQNPNTKEIIGVKAKNKGKGINIKARKAVVLCSGGFECDEEMQKNYLRPYPLKPAGWRYNTGDGIKMAQAVGADLWHMNVVSSSGQQICPPGSEALWASGRSNGDNYIWVTRYGKRFTCESPAWFDHRSYMGFAIWDWSDTQKYAGYPCIPFYLIFDEEKRLAGPIAFGLPTFQPGKGITSGNWSQDNIKEIESGWVKKGNTIKELAAAIGPDMDPALLEETIAKWNGFCAAGKDTDFGRSQKMGPLDKPPFYGVEVYPGVFNTCGGPRKNGKAQVLDTKKNPIPRLYEAGVLGSTTGHIYCISGHNWSEFMAFGRIAGRNAAAEKSWL
jgi:succinate dehydrogenase/fumarate reductase flavoprotein subunit